jgi:cell division protein FtsB
VIRPVTILAGVAVVLVILLAPYLRPWLAQRSDIAEKRAQVEALQRQVDDLRVERNRWNDPTFVKAQAREHLNFVMPGELGYVVLDDGEQQPKGDPAQRAIRDTGRIGGRPWYDVFWQSVQLAGRSTTAPGTPGSGAGPRVFPAGGAASPAPTSSPTSSPNSSPAPTASSGSTGPASGPTTPGTP